MKAGRAASAELAAMRGPNHVRRARGDPIAVEMRGVVRAEAMTSVRG
jgi:hypothetical protein